jgi:hypothetical protein
VTWPGGGVEHHLSHGEWIAVLRRNGFTVEALHELYPPEGAATPDHAASDHAASDYYEIVTEDWASRWPAEELWVAELG